MNSLQFTVCARKAPVIQVSREVTVWNKTVILSHYWDLNPRYRKKTARGLCTLEYNKTLYGTLLLLHVVRF